MKLFTLAFILVAVLALTVPAEPEPEPAKGQRAAIPKFRSAGDVEKARASDEVAEAEDAGEDTPNKSGSGDASSGRLFMKKFLLFKNMFGANTQQQPVIPIIIAGGTGTGGTGGTYVTPTSPTYQTVTSTGSIPTATGTITTSPTTGGGGGGARVGYNADDAEAELEEAAAVDEEALQAALSAGAQEYVVTDQEIKGTSDAKASRPARVNLRRKGAKKGQVVSVRIPPKYRQYFKNGQKVMLNTNNRPNKRRVVQKRINRTRRRRPANKRRRVVAQ